MMDILGGIFLILGALLCLLAAWGVLTLQDFFMRMHAATKAGVAGCGFILLGVACVDNTMATWIKVIVAITFMIVTTPLAGHLLGRAAYVSGSPLWRGTQRDDLAGKLPRGRFEKQDDGTV